MRPSPTVAVPTRGIGEMARANKDPGVVEQVRHYRLITPLFGGGVEPGVNDDLTPVTGKAIRGHLRFWWRATRGIGTLAEMKKREDEIWGAPSTKKKKTPSLIQLKATVNKVGKSDKPFSLRDGDRPRPNRDSIVPQYAAFPLQPTDDDIQNARKDRRDVTLKEVLTGVEFTLQIAFPLKARPDAAAALWAWETFGGIGGRTRRGFGALDLVKVDENGKDVTPPRIQASDAEEQIRQKLRSENANGYLAEGKWDDRVPHLSPTTRIRVKEFSSGKTSGQRTDKNLKAWYHLINNLERFRQSRNRPRGRSRWPEPDTIRRIVGAGKFKHTPVHRVEKFPRAHFGLPIIFHFNRDEMTNRESFQVELKPAKHKRLGSPLILRPIACAKGDAVAMAIILETAKIPSDWVELGVYGTVKTDLHVSDIESISPPMNPPETDVLISFLDTIT
jgi:CRISPR-associated protein Cmr1